MKAIATTFRIPDALLKRVQHRCIDQNISQADACIRGLTLWVDGWEDAAASAAAAGSFPPAYLELMRVARVAEARGVTVREMVTVITWLGAPLVELPLGESESEGSAAERVAKQILQQVQRLVLLLNRGDDKAKKRGADRH